MMGLPRLRRREAPQWQRRRLAAWLHEWELDRALRRAGEDADATGDGGAAHGALAADQWDDPAVSADEPAPATGQVRLLTPRAAGRERLLYVAIIDARRPDAVLIAPYGRFAEPALPGELLTRRREHALRVLCMWNTRRVTTALLRDSWWIDDLDAQEQRDASAVYRATQAGTDLPPELAQRVGPPLADHPSDPRRVYRRGEEAFMNRVVREAAGGDAGAAGSIRYPAGSERPLRRAAEPRAPYGDDAAAAPEP
jgi:hypothetical protein